MKTFLKPISLFLLLTVSASIFAQQKKYIYFDELWELSSSKYNQYYFCECYVLENGAYDGPFNCYNIVSEAKVKTYHFSNNVLDGEVLEYYENGNVKLHAFYNKGIPTKTWKEWNASGELVVDKVFDENDVIIKDKKKKLSDYEKMYFGEKPFEAPVYTTDCILKKNETEKYKCSDLAMFAYYKHPPLPPSYFNKPSFSGKTFVVKLKYQLSEKGKVIDTKIIETSGDAFLDELAAIHVLNMIPFESAKEYENPIKYWIDADIYFKF